MEGRRYHFNDTVLTVWSAPNYCYRCGNVAAILRLDEFLNREFAIFEAAPQVRHLFLLLSFQTKIFSICSSRCLQNNRSFPSRKPVPDYFL